MSACHLQGQGCCCSPPVFSNRSWLFIPKPCRRKLALVTAIASATNVATLEPKTLSIDLRPSTRGYGSTLDETSSDSATWPSPRGANETIAMRLRDSQAQGLKELSAEISRLVAELDTELTTYLDSTAAVLHQHQQQTRRQSSSVSHFLATSSKPATPADSRRQPTVSFSASGQSHPPSPTAFDPLALTVPTAPPGGPAALPPLLSLPLPAVGSAEAGASGTSAGAGSRAERRRQNWRRSAAGAVASVAPDHEAKFKATGTGSISILMGSFTKDHILSSEEEQLLAAAAQDFMQLTELSRVLGAVLRRPPSLAEVAKSLHCEEAALRVRLDCGNSARTLLAQKNYRLVVNIAKRLVRPSAAVTAGGSASSAGAAGGGAGAAGGGGSGSGSSGVSLDDAITVGMEALMYAIRKFKPEAGCRLSTYATWWIRQYIGRLVHVQTGIISMSVYQRANLDRLRAARAQLRALLPAGVNPTQQQLAEASGLSLGQLAQLEAVERTFAAGTRSFEAPVVDKDGDGARTVDDLVAQDSDLEASEDGSSLFQDSEDFAASASLSSTVEGLLASLDRGEADLLRRQYGLTEEAASGGRARNGGAAATEEAQGTPEERSALVAGGGVAVQTGVQSGASRLKLGRKNRQAAARALQKLRRSAEDDSGLADWLQLHSAKDNVVARTTGGYAKKSNG